MLTWKIIGVSIMDRIMGGVCGRDEELRIEYVIITVHDVVRCHWIHVVNEDAIVDCVSLNTQIVALITSDDMMADISPLFRLVKVLIEKSIETKSVSTDRTSKNEVIESFVKRFESG